MLCKKLHHAAFRCKDARETVEFYTKVLGLKFAHAMGEDHVPSTGKYSPHVHIFLEMEDGSSIAFFECPNDPGNMKDMESPDWIQHFAFEVESVEDLLKAKADMEAKGVKIIGPTNHDDFIEFDLFLRSVRPSPGIDRADGARSQTHQTIRTRGDQGSAIMGSNP